MREASLRRPPGSVRRTQTDPFAQHVALDAGAHRHRVVEADQLPRRKPAQRSAIDRSPQHEATRQTARNRSTDPAPARCQCAAVALGHRRVGRAHSRHRGRRSGASRPARAARPGRCGRSHALPPPPPDRRWPAALIGQPVRTKACLGRGLRSSFMTLAEFRDVLPGRSWTISFFRRAVLCRVVPGSPWWGLWSVFQDPWTAWGVRAITPVAACADTPLYGATAQANEGPDLKWLDAAVASGPGTHCHGVDRNAPGRHLHDGLARCGPQPREQPPRAAPLLVIRGESRQKPQRTRAFVSRRKLAVSR
jgi:hypothetical protein